jgi:hypothetical protein
MPQRLLKVNTNVVAATGHSAIWYVQLFLFNAIEHARQRYSHYPAVLVASA